MREPVRSILVLTIEARNTILDSQGCFANGSVSPLRGICKKLQSQKGPFFAASPKYRYNDRSVPTI
jgi:hypothetical protein